MSNLDKLREKRAVEMNDLADFRVEATSYTGDQADWWRGGYSPPPSGPVSVPSCWPVPEPTVHTCPVCLGRGIVMQGFYLSTSRDGAWMSAGTGTEPCRGCDGNGWVKA